MIIKDYQKSNVKYQLNKCQYYTYIFDTEITKTLRKCNEFFYMQELASDISLRNLQMKETNFSISTKTWTCVKKRQRNVENPEGQKVVCTTFFDLHIFMI